MEMDITKNKHLQSFLLKECAFESLPIWIETHTWKGQCDVPEELRDENWRTNADSESLFSDSN